MRILVLYQHPRRKSKYIAPLFVFYRKTVLPESRTEAIPLAAETAKLAENLPDGAAVGIAAGITKEETHLADLLIKICLARTVGIVTVL